MTVDGTGHIYVIGNAISFPVTPGTFQTDPPPRGHLSLSDPRVVGSGAFVAKLTPAGELVSATYLHGLTLRQYPPDVYGTAIAVDASGSVLLAGHANGPLPVSIPGPFNRPPGDCPCSYFANTGFLVKFSPDLTTLEWGFYIPALPLRSPQTISIRSMALDRSGNIVIAGNTSNLSRVSDGAIQKSIPPQVPQYRLIGFLNKLDRNGRELLVSTYFGSDVAELALDAEDRMWVTGESFPADALPAPSGTVLLGPSYVAGLRPDGSAVESLITAPSGTSG